MISGNGELGIVRMSGAETLRLKEFSRKNGVTLFMTMLAVFKTLLYRYTGVEDLCVGTGVANRGYKEMEGMLGMVINTLSLRTQLAGEISFHECLKRVKETCLEAYQHEDTPFGKVVEVMQPERNLSYTPIFQVLFSFMDTPGERLRLPGLELELLPGHNRSAKFDINVVVAPPPEQDETGDEETLVEWEYNTDIFEAPTIRRVISHYNRLLVEGLNRPETALGNLPMLSDEEIKQLLYEFNDTEIPYPQDKTIQEIFVEQVEKVPDHIALVESAPQTFISYNELHEQSGRLAGLLIEKGIKAGDNAGIMLERSIDLITGIIGILKAGGAYLPIDPGYPQERIQYMLKDSGISLCINEKFFGGKGAILQKSPLVKTKHAYIMYTSGSTGRPKGIIVTQRNVVRLVKNTNFVSLTQRTRILQTGAPVFDATTFEIWGSLLNGGQLVLVAKETILDGQLLGKTLKKHKINTLWLSAPLFNRLQQQNSELFAPLNYLLVGGDILSPAHINRVRHQFPGLKIINGYGPTENTTFSTTFEINEDYKENIPIGKPIANSTAYIYDKRGQFVPVGVWGELAVGGDGVALGYLNNPELTAEKFNNDLLDSQDNQDKKKKRPLVVYKTGDLARWLSNGIIEFKGRIDQQVKIRGYRIELGEIEGRLRKHSRVKDAVVIDRKVEGEKYLCAYIVPRGGIENSPGTSELRTYLQGCLPDYMIPSFFMFLEKIPLTPNGKIDRKALPGVGSVNMAKEYISPRDEIEKKLAEIWTAVLKPSSAMGIDDNFFDLGGHSLNATLLTARMHKVFNVKIPLKEFFQRGCIREVAEFLKGAAREEYIRIEPAEEKEYYPLSAAQKRMYILHRMDESGISYNIPAIMELEGELDKKQLKEVFIKLIKRHESLRTSFITINEKPVQRIHGHVEFEIESIDLATESTAEIGARIHHFSRVFDLSKAPLLRVALAAGQGKQLLMVDMPHIITDGTSMELFTAEFMALYAGRELPPLKLQYKDYSVWWQSDREKDSLKAQEQYWLKQFSEAPAALELPLDFPRPVVQSYEGSGYTFEISETETGALKALASAKGTTLYMVLSSLYYIFLSKLTGQEDIVIGTPVAGRSHADLEPIMGLFVNTLALRNSPVREKNFCEFLKEVNENTLAAFANQDYPYEELVEKVVVTRDTGRNPLFDTLLNLRNMDIPEIAIPGLKMKPYPFSESISKFDLSLRVFDGPEKLRFTFEYCTALFKMETIERFVGVYKAVIARIIQEPQTLMAEIEIITEAEKKQILIDFNNTAVAYPRDKTIQQLFSEQVEKSPDRIALISFVGADPRVCPNLSLSPVSLTYCELNRQAGHLAGLLIEKGVRANDLVAIMIERSIDLIIGILGILKAGGAYLPIDPDYPQERIDYMLKDSRVRILIKSPKDLIVLNFENSDFEFVSNFGFRISNFNSSNFAYIMYTSGSTGQPKGVVVTQRNVVRLVKNANFVSLTEDTRILQTGAPVFDATTFEIWGSLLNGGQLVLVDKDIILNAHRLAKTLIDHQINTLWLSAALFNRLMQQNSDLFDTLRYLLVGGDVLSPVHINRVRQKCPGLKVINGYGPTENTTFSTTYLIDKEFAQNIPIGRPIANSRAYIYDKGRQPVPIGVWGELYVGGDGVALGYMNNPELTAEKFGPQITQINKSFAGVKGELFQKRPLVVYKTGDQVRWLPDGNIEFLGRIDKQVKIRGFRIELGEIENRLLKHPHIKEAVVIDRNVHGDKIICAYYVPVNEGAPGNIPGVTDLREYLAHALPDYMIPTFFVPIAKIPLTPNGKVNRPALPEPGPQGSDHYIAPENQMEEELVEIWAGVLGIEKKCISVDVNLFELGANSLKIINVNNRLRELYNRDIPAATMFRYSNIRMLAQYLQDGGKKMDDNFDEMKHEIHHAVDRAKTRMRARVRR
ncbi:MAG TPA: amino acid adenylation domain-containing protein [Candidatus Deferrimicrobium sp.]|nr:amino acid adenylation domain-containing protein [Candidatus Deferrimicrobium sp.]